MNEIIIKDESYVNLLEEIKATEAEHSFNERMERVNMYWEIGNLINTYQQQHNLGVTLFISELHKDLKYAERSLWFAKEFAERFPTQQEMESSLPDGKATSWTKVKALLSNSTEKTDDTLDLSKVAKGILTRYGPDNAKMIAREILAITQ